MNLKHWFKKVGKIVGGLALIAMLGGQVISATQKTSADSPEFNVLEGDHEMFRALNYTKGETVYTDPVTAGDKEKVVASIYYHNGVVNTTAANTTIKVAIPSTSTTTTKLLDASISADNAATVHDTVVNKTIVGKSGLTIQTPTADSTVDFVPGSVRWFPNRSTTPVDLPGGVSGDSLVTTGLNIGDINGCWEFSGFVTFAMVVNTPAHQVLNPNLKLEKTVRNLAINEAFNKSDSAFAGDLLEYKLDVINDGQADAQDVIVKDMLPVQTSYIPGSLKYFPAGSNIPMSLLDGQTAEQLFADGIMVGELHPGSTHSTKFIFQVKIAGSDLAAGQELVNKTFATADSLQAADQVVTVIKVPEVPEVKKPIISLSKSAFNQTKNIDAQTVLASAGDTIEYSLITRNTGNGEGTVEVKDGIADVLEYATVIDSEGGQLISQPQSLDQDDQMLIDFGQKTLQPGGVNVSKFMVKVKSPIPTNPQNGFHFDHVMFNRYGNPVIIKVETPVAPPVVVKVETPPTVITQTVTKTVPQNTQLPRTGGGETLAAIIAAGFVATNIVYFSGKRKLKNLALAVS